MRALAKAPEDRFQDADAFIAALQAARDAPMDAPAYAVAGPVVVEEDHGRRWWLWLLAALLLAYAGGVYAWASHDAVERIDFELASDFEEISGVLELNSRGEFVLPVELDDAENADGDDVPLVEIHDGDGRPLLRLPPGRAATAATDDWRPSQEPITANLADGTRARVIRAAPALYVAKANSALSSAVIGSVA